MVKKTDLRIIKTYKALTNAFSELLGEKPFEDITVSELCSRALIRRATFYKHFTDKHEFLSFYIKDMQQDFIERTRKKHYPENKETYLLNTIEFTLEYAEQNENILKSLVNSSMATEIMRMIIEQSASEIKTYLKMLPPENLPAPPELMSHLLAGAVFQGAMWWLTHKTSVNKNEMAKMLKRFLLKNVGVK